MKHQIMKALCTHSAGVVACAEGLAAALPARHQRARLPHKHVAGLIPSPSNNVCTALRIQLYLNAVCTWSPCC